MLCTPIQELGTEEAGLIIRLGLIIHTIRYNRSTVPRVQPVVSHLVPLMTYDNVLSAHCLLQLWSHLVLLPGSPPAGRQWRSSLWRRTMRGLRSWEH